MTRPGVWFTLAAVIVLLVGVLVWAVLGRIDTTVGVAVVSKGGESVCYVPYEKAESIKSSGKVSVAGKEYTINDIGMSPLYITADTDINLRVAGNFAEGAVVLPLEVVSELPTGIYKGEVTVEAIKPISFILN